MKPILPTDRWTLTGPGTGIDNHDVALVVNAHRQVVLRVVTESGTLSLHVTDPQALLSGLHTAVSVSGGDR